MLMNDHSDDLRGCVCMEGVSPGDSPLGLGHGHRTSTRRSRSASVASFNAALRPANRRSSPETCPSPLIIDPRTQLPHPYPIRQGLCAIIEGFLIDP